MLFVPTGCFYIYAALFILGIVVQLLKFDTKLALTVCICMCVHAHTQIMYFQEIYNQFLLEVNDLLLIAYLRV